MDTPTVSPERAQYQAALERHITIKHKASIAFEVIRLLNSERDILREEIAELKKRLDLLRNSAAFRGAGEARKNAVNNVLEVEREIASLQSVLALGESMKAAYQEQANCYAPQRDVTAPVIQRMKNELLILEKAGQQYDMHNDQDAHSRTKDY